MVLVSQNAQLLMSLKPLQPHRITYAMVTKALFIVQQHAWTTVLHQSSMILKLQI